MKVLVIGSGGREHALAWRLARSPRVETVISCPGNGGLAQLGPLWTDLDPVRDPDQLLARIRSERIGFVVIGPEAPLVAGLADRLRAAGVPTFGPNQAGARLEGSKAYAKEFMQRHGIPTAASVTITDSSQLDDALARFTSPPVVKADGLAAGKGVVVAETWDEARGAAHEMLVEGRFGPSGATVVLEERMRGTEVTLLVLVSGTQYQVLESAQDYKPRFDGNRGPNTGGMGAFSPSRNLDAAGRVRAIDEVLVPTLRGLEAEGIDYRGVLYLGLMLTDAGPKVVEYNVRFGDPETQPLMVRLESDLLDAFEAIEHHRLDEIELTWSEQAAVCVVLAAEDYPQGSSKGVPIDCADPGPDAVVFHAGTRMSDGQLVTNGGRVFGVTALGRSVDDARERAYRALGSITFPGKSYRSDIAARSTP